MWPPAPQQSGFAYLDQVAIGIADVAGPTSHIVKLCIWSCHSTSHHAACGQLSACAQPLRSNSVRRLRSAALAGVERGHAAEVNAAHAADLRDDHEHAAAGAAADHRSRRA